MRTINGTYQSTKAVHPFRIMYVWGLLIALLNVADVVSTMYGIEAGSLVENNWFMKPVVEHWWSAIAVKLVVLPVFGGLIYTIRTKAKLAIRTLVIVSAWYTFVVGHNIAIINGHSLL